MVEIGLKTIECQKSSMFGIQRLSSSFMRISLPSYFAQMKAYENSSKVIDSSTLHQTNGYPKYMRNEASPSNVDFEPQNTPIFSVFTIADRGTRNDYRSKHGLMKTILFSLQELSANRRNLFSG